MTKDTIIKLAIVFIFFYFVILFYILHDSFDIQIEDILNIDYILLLKTIHYDFMAEDILLYVMNLYLYSPLIIVFVYFNKRNLKGDHGNAKFANISDMKKMNIIHKTNKALPLAKFGKQKLSTLEPLSCLILAPPGTGKSVAAIDMLMNTDQSFIVLDIKGELHEKTSRFREHYFKNKIMIFNPLREESICFNPFSYDMLNGLKWDEISKRVKFVSEIFYQNKNENDYWTNEGKSLFIGSALYLIETNKYTSIPKIRSFMLSDWRKEIITYYDKLIQNNIEKQEPQEQERLKELLKNLNMKDDKIEELIKKVKELKECSIKTFIEHVILKNENTHRQIKEAFSKLMAKGENELGSILGTGNSSLDAFDTDMILKKMNTNDLDITSFRKEKISLYIIVSEDEVKSLRPIVKLFMEYSAINLLSKEPQKEKKLNLFTKVVKYSMKFLGINIFQNKKDIVGDNNIIILFDEFPRFGKLEYIISLPALGRSYKVIVILISQDFAQIKATYEQTTVNTILSTTAHKIVYRQMNPETAKMFSEMIGNHEVEQTSVSESKSGKSTSYTLVSKPLVSPQDILSQDKNKIYLLEFGFYNRPIMCEPLKWYEDKRLIKMLDNIPKENKTTINNKPLVETKSKKKDESPTRERTIIEDDQINKTKVEQEAKQEAEEIRLNKLFAGSIYDDGKPKFGKTFEEINNEKDETPKKKENKKEIIIEQSFDMADYHKTKREKKPPLVMSDGKKVMSCELD